VPADAPTWSWTALAGSGIARATGPAKSGAPLPEKPRQKPKGGEKSRPSRRGEDTNASRTLRVWCRAHGAAEWVSIEATWGVSKTRGCGSHGGAVTGSDGRRETEGRGVGQESFPGGTAFCFRAPRHSYQAPRSGWARHPVHPREVPRSRGCRASSGLPDPTGRARGSVGGRRAIGNLPHRQWWIKRLRLEGHGSSGTPHGGRRKGCAGQVEPKATGRRLVQNSGGRGPSVGLQR